MEALAKLKHLKGSPRKARLVIDLIRGRNVSQALAILKFTDKRAADPIAKTLRSAIANATFQAEKDNIAIDPDDLFVKSCFVDMGAHKNRRRMRPAPQGRAYREQRHYCHITIEVSSDKPAEAETKKIGIKEKTGNESPSKSPKSSAGKTNARNPLEKTGSVKDAKKSKTDETVIDETTTATADSNVETTSPKASEASKPTAENEAQNQADAANVKDAESQTTAERNEPKRADEAQLDRNEELERQ